MIRTGTTMISLALVLALSPAAVSRDFTDVRVLGTETAAGARIAGELLRARIADRTALSSAGDVFEVTYVLDAALTGEVARVRVKDGAAEIRAGRTRAFVAGSGNLLKSLRYGMTSFAATDGAYDFTPAKELRMAYLARHFLCPYMEAPVEMMCRYIEDLALDGINSFMMPYGIDVIDVSYETPARIAAFERKSRQMYDRLRALDCGYCTGGAGNQLPQDSPECLRGEPNVVPRRGNAGFNACPAKPGGMEAILAWQRTNLDKLKGVTPDFFSHWSFDEGGCNCAKCRPWGGNGMPRMMEKLVATERIDFPKSKAIYSTWYFEVEDYVALWKYLETCDWIDYLLIADPGIDPDYPVRNPPPGRAKLITFPEISMWGRAPWGGFGSIVFARRLEKAFRQVEKVVSGFIYYSEGFFEDINKAVVTDLYVNPSETVEGILRRYAAYHFAGTDPEDFVRLAALLEKTHRIEDYRQADLLAAKALVDKMDREMLPSLRNTWRWRLVYLRATLDDGLFASRYLAYEICEHGDVLSPEMHACFDELARINCTQIQTKRFLEGYRYGATASLYVPSGEKVKVHTPPAGLANDYLKPFFADQMIQGVRLGPGTWHLEPMDVDHVTGLKITLTPGCHLVRPDGTPYEKATDAFRLPPNKRFIELVGTRDFAITDYGAKADGSKCTAAFAAAIAAAEKAGGGRVAVPPGKWLTGAIRLKSNCELYLADGAEVLFSQDPNDYLPAVPTSWEGMECWNYCPLVYAYGCTNVAITGTGTLRAYEGAWEDTAWYPWVPQANGVRAARRQLYDWGAQDVPVEKRQIWKMPNAHTRPHFIQFNRCRNVRCQNFRIRNSPFWTLHLYQCSDVTVRRLDVSAHGNNNDGIDIEMSRNVLVELCTFDQGDDGVVIKSGRNRDAWRLATPTENVIVRDCRIKSAHTMFGIGSEISGGVRNVRMENCRGDDVSRVFYVKTNRRRGGTIENVTCEDVSCRSASQSVFEIATDVLYEWAKFPDYENRVTAISNVVARDIHVGTTKNRVKLVGDPRLPPRNIRMERVTADVVTGVSTEVKNVYGFVEDGLPNFAKRRLVDSGEALGTSVYDDTFNRVVAADRACDAKWLSLKTPAELAACQREVREKAVAAMGGFPARTPLNARTTGTIERKGYRIEKVLFESRPHFFVTGHLYVPTDPKYKGPFPALLAPCGHSFAGKAAPWYSHTGVYGAARGFVVLVYDPIEQGERHQKRDGRVKWSTTEEHNNIGGRAFLLGESAAQVRLFDGLRAVDYLASRTDLVDPKKIGVAGISGGGTLSAYINAFEPQIACAAPAGFLSTVRDVYDNCGPQDAEQVIFGQLAYGLNHLGLVALRAPSPILVTASHGDFFPFIGSTDTAGKAKRVFAAAGAADRVDLLSVPGPHHWYNSQKDIQLGWMTRWFEGRGDAYDRDTLAARRRAFGTDYCEGRGGIANETPEVRNVVPNGRVLDLPGARSIYDIYREKLARAKAARKPLTPEIVRTVTGIRPLAELSAAELPAESGVVLSRDDDETLIPIVIARPETPSRQPPVLIVSDVSDRTNLAETVRHYLAEGRAVAVADARGFGETSGSRHSFYGSNDAGEEIALCLMALGDSIVARRAEDILLAARYAARALGARPVLHAEGRAVVPAVHAAYLEPRLFAGVTTVRAPDSWETLVADDSIRTYPFSCLVRAALLAYDWTDLLANSAVGMVK